MEICKDGHANQAGGCCCPTHGNTCGFHPEWSKGSGILLPSTKKFSRPMDLEDLANRSPEWWERLQKFIRV